MKKLFLISISIFLAFISENAKAQVSLSLFVSGFPGVVDIKNVGDNRIFVVTQYGYIKIVDTSGTVNPVPFLDIHNIVTGSGGEQGLE